MIENTVNASSILVLTMAAAGFALGIGYFAALRATVKALAAQDWRGLAVVLTLGRLSVAVVGFALAAGLGAPALLATFIGFLLARFAALRLAKDNS